MDQPHDDAMTQMPGAAPGPDHPPVGDVTDRRKCITCSYELLGLPVSGVCPECGTAVALSMRDNLLVNSSPAYLATIHRGVFLIQLAIIVMILGFMFLIAGTILMTALRPGAGAGVGAGAVLTVTFGGAVLTVVPALIGLYGWWKFSEPDPRASETDRGEKPRRVVRAVVVIELALLIAAQGGSVLVLLVGPGPAPGPGGPGGPVAAAMPALLAVGVMLLSVAAYIAMAVRFFASMLYVRWLSPRVPNEKAFKRAKLLMWLGPVLCTVGVLACYIGPLVALVLYYNLLEWVRVDIKRVRAVVERRGGDADRMPTELASG